MLIRHRVLSSPVLTVFIAIALTATALVSISAAAQSAAGTETSATNSPDAVAGKLQLSGEQAITSSEDYLISADDVLDVVILDVPEMSRQYRVSPIGAVKVPLLSQPLLAAGLTLEQFSEKLASELREAGLVSSPQVTTSVKESRAHSVAVAGAVKRPQIYAVLGRTTLLDVISQAEGLTDDAGSVAVVQRGLIAQPSLTRQGQPGASNEGLIERVDLKQLMESGDPSLNIIIYPGDRITVPRAGLVYVVGAVNQPGGYPAKASRQGTTVLQAIALAKDIKPTAVPSKALIIRIDPSAPQGRAQIPVDLKKVLAGKGADPVLQAEDILFVPDSNSKKAFRRGMESILQVATGLAIYGRY